MNKYVPQVYVAKAISEFTCGFGRKIHIDRGRPFLLVIKENGSIEYVDDQDGSFGTFANIEEAKKFLTVTSKSVRTPEYFRINYSAAKSLKEKEEI